RAHRHAAGGALLSTRRHPAVRPPPTPGAEVSRAPDARAASEPWRCGLGAHGPVRLTGPHVPNLPRPRTGPFRWTLAMSPGLAPAPLPGPGRTTPARNRAGC